MTTLYAEVIASILAAAFIGLLVGWMFSAARSRRHRQQAQQKWARKTADLENKHAAEVDDLEVRLQSASEDLQKLTKQKRKLESLAQQNDTGVDRARSDAIELNSKQAELQERLHRKIREQERQITELLGQTAPVAGSHGAATQPQRDRTSVAEEEAYIDQLSARGGHQRPHEQQNLSGASAATTEDDLDDDFDATAVLDMNIPFEDARTDAIAAVSDNHSFADTLDATEISAPDLSAERISERAMDDSLDGFEDATLALDEEALARARNLR